MYSLLVLGGLALEGDSGPLSGPATQRHRLALMALLASAYPRGLLREKLVAHLWPERGPDRARNLLHQAVHAVRSVVGDGAILSAGDELRLDPTVLACDLIAFELAMAEDDFAHAAACYRGPFLDGFFLPDAGEFERWLDGERRRLGERYRRALEELARAATATGDGRTAVEWWRRLAADDPYNADVTGDLMRALEAVGDRAAAIEAGRVYAVLVSGDLEAEPDPAVEALADRMRTDPRPRAKPPVRSAVAPRAPGDRPSAGPAPTPPTRAPHRTRHPAKHVGLALAAGALTIVVATLVLKGLAMHATPIANRAGARPGDSPAVSMPPDEPVARDTVDETGMPGAPTASEYVRRAYALADFSREGSREAERLLRAAIRADSNDASAWADLSIVYGWSSPYLGEPASVWDSALVFAQRARDLDPSSAVGYTALAVAYGHQGRLALEERMASEAVSRDSTDALAYRRLAESLRERGEFLKALHYHRLSVHLRPTYRVFQVWVGHTYRDLRAYVQAEDWYRRVLALEPYRIAALEGMVGLYLRLGIADSARRYADQLVRHYPRETRALTAAASVSHYLRDVEGVRRLAGRAVEIAAGAPARAPNTTLATTMLGFAELVAGDTARADSLFEKSVAFLEARRTSGADSPRWTYELAMIDAARGDTAAALDELDQAYALGFRWVWMLEADPMLDGVRGRPRFEALVARTRADVEAMRRRVDD